MDLFEDHYGDVLGKARFGLGLTPEEASRRSQLALAELAALEGGAPAPREETIRAAAAALALSPDKLAAFARQPEPPRPLAPPLPFVHVPVSAGFTMNAYVFADPATREAAVVDPGGDLPAIAAAVAKLGATPSVILLTHAHGDHVGALEAAVSAWHVPVHALEPERRRLGALARHVSFQDPAKTPAAKIAVGRIEVRMVHVPGHTAGMAAFLLPAAGLAFVGDALFARSLGRAEAPGEAYATLLAAVREQILSLPPDTVLCPGHGPLTTVRDESRLNPFFV